ncbi:MAG: oxidoreductase [Ahniella sp.]|nr:oxidoreductase [Ahniella sp.]
MPRYAFTQSFRAFRIHQDGKTHRAGIESMAVDQLSAGEVVIQTAFSSVNYKDALTGTGTGKILRQFPLNGGIDVAGHVVASADPAFREGDAVLVTGSGLSETRDGGYSEYARLDARQVIPLPNGLSLRDAMILGTAGFTKVDQFDALIQLGARQCVARQGLHWGQRPLEAATWAGAIDSVGGEMLSGLTRVIKPYGNIAICGLAGGDELHTTVMPFIIRGVSLLGVASSGTAYSIRRQIWERLAGAWKPAHLAKICTHSVTLEELPGVFARMLTGGSFGRTLVQF